MPADKKHPDHKRIRPLPGQRSGTPSEMANYIITLKEQSSPPLKSPSRRELFKMNEDRTAEFLGGLLRWLDEQGLRSQVAGIAEPMGFPMITLVSTPSVAKAIAALPEVESVVRDSDTLRIVP